jgi:hypothetical protein
VMCLRSALMAEIHRAPAPRVIRSWWRRMLPGGRSQQRVGVRPYPATLA